jgi:hypothetical protein
MIDNHSHAPAPWTSRNIIRAGGLVGLGFGASSDLLLVVTHDGRGVIDCLTGELLARDPDPIYPLDEESREVTGIGPIADQEIVIAGDVYGGSLLQSTEDGWSLTGTLTNQSNDVLTLTPPPAEAGQQYEKVQFSDFVPEIRVFGFSPTGRSFVIGTGAEVTIFARSVAA